MDLFSDTQTTNILPFDGNVIYLCIIFSRNEANHFLNELFNSIEWKQDEAFVFGKHMFTNRKVAWYGDEPFTYSYSNHTKTALPWTPELITLKKIVENKTETSYNSCLLNLYHDGSEGMAWHSDDESTLKKNGTIAALSFGADRKFSFKHKTKKASTSVVLEHGSLLLMKDETQTYWLHRLPTTKYFKKNLLKFTIIPNKSLFCFIINLITTYIVI